MSSSLTRFPPLEVAPPAIVAHRGNALEYPENTIAALRSAIQLGAPFVEFDVQLAADEVPVLIHDESLIRTAGRPESVFDLNASDLQRIEVTERSRFGDRFSDIRVPTLEQATELIAAHPGVIAFVEIKRASIERFGAELVVARIAERLRPIRQQCVVISFDLPGVCLARRCGLEAIGWVLREYDRRSQLKCEAMAPDYVFCDRELLPPAPEPLWRGPWCLAVYEIRRVEEALALAARGVELVETQAVRSLLRGLAAPRHSAN